MKLQRYEPEISKITSTTASARMVQSECGSWVRDCDIDGLEAAMASNFTAGAKAIFDALLFRAANNYHGNLDIDKACQAENAIIASWAEDALREVSPEICAEWHGVNDLIATNAELRAENALLRELLGAWYGDVSIPHPNCSCHISPPCNDCIEWGGLRETADQTKRILGVKP